MDNKKQGAEKRLAQGAIIYMIGNFTSKILQMLILPITTAVIATSEYGYYDLIITSISLITPLVTFQLIEGMFRFSFKVDDQTKIKTISTVASFLIIGFLLMAGAVWLIYSIYPVFPYLGLIYLNFVSTIVFNFAQKLARCQQRNKQFAISGVLHTIVLLITQAIVLLVFDMGIKGLLLANCISYFVAALYLAVILNIKHWVRFRNSSLATFKDLMVYSAPLIPNSLCWWFVSSSDRYIITFFLGASANGIYSITGKFSQLITFTTNVFQLAWQESAIMEQDNTQRDKFYSSTFNAYMRILFGTYLIILPFVRLILPFMVDEAYEMGYLYFPLLMLGCIASALSQFYGSAYLVFKKTKGAFVTTLIAAVINIVVGASLIPVIGLYAPAIGTIAAFGIQWIIRIFQMKDYFRVRVDGKCLITLLIFAIIATMLYYTDSLCIHILSFTIGGVICLAFNRNLIAAVFKKIVLANIHTYKSDRR